MPHQCTKIPRVCATCGKGFTSRPDRPGTFCSRECLAFAKPVALSCRHCGGTFSRRPHVAHRAHFCSKRCQWLSRKVAHICPRCGTTFHRKSSQTAVTRYCSRACKENETDAEIADRFWSYVEKGPSCWLWTGRTLQAGYGQFTAHKQRFQAHRWAFAATYGPILEGAEICHSCDNPPCVNPDHLWLGNAQTNCDDKIAKGRHVHGERCHNAKVTEAQVREIRRLHATTKVTQAAIARRFGLQKQLVGRIIRRATWHHL